MRQLDFFKDGVPETPEKKRQSFTLIRGMLSAGFPLTGMVSYLKAFDMLAMEHFHYLVAPVLCEKGAQHFSLEPPAWIRHAITVDRWDKITEEYFDGTIGRKATASELMLVLSQASAAGPILHTFVCVYEYVFRITMKKHKNMTDDDVDQIINKAGYALDTDQQWEADRLLVSLREKAVKHGRFVWKRL